MTEHLGTYDEVLEKIGQFGPWQKKIIVFLWLPPILAGMGFMQYSFAAGTPKSRCLVIANNSDVFESSAVTEFDLVCDRNHLKASHSAGHPLCIEIFFCQHRQL